MDPPTGHPPPVAEEGGYPSTPSPRQGQTSLSLQALGRGAGAGAHVGVFTPEAGPGKGLWGLGKDLGSTGSTH